MKFRKKMEKNGKKTIFRIITAVVFVVLAFGGLTVLLNKDTKAATSGQTIFYLHKESPDANETYNSLALTRPEPGSDTTTATATSTTNINASPPTSFCQSSDNSSNTYNVIRASAASTGNRCMGTFISMPVGQSIVVSTGDASAISGQFWSSESATQVASAMNIFIYRWSGSGTTVGNTGNEGLATFTCAEPGTSATSCIPTAAAPAASVTLSATDRIVVIVSMNVTTLRSGASVSVYFDSTARAASQVTMKYTLATPNKPTLSGSMDDDFTTSLAPLTCTTGGVAMTGDTKWTCLQGSAASSTGTIQDGALAGTIGGDSSGFMKLDNQFTANGTSSDFAGSSGLSTPSNTFLYQSLPDDYSSGNVRTVVNGTNNFTINSTNAAAPFNHDGLVLWTSNTDYIQVQVYAGAAIDGVTANTVKVGLNVNGTITTSTGINTSVSNGLFNSVWLGFANTNGSWQAQYSTDGSTWNNLGSPINHATFSRVGLNAFTALGSVSGDYAGAFDWFQSTLTNAIFTQDAYIWDNNADSVIPGTALASNNTSVTLTSSGANFRLRLAIEIAGQISSAGNQQFKLQYVDMGSGTCAAPSGGTPATYTDVTAGTSLAYFNNPTPTDGASIGGQPGKDPSVSGTGSVFQSYEEANNFAVLIPINDSHDGVWDFSLIDNGAPSSTTYCLRVVDSGGAALTTYSAYPTITTFSPGPTTDQVLRGGEWFSSGTKQPFFWAQ
jgi:hypothetical protein